jgi:hypothetical protein
MLIGVDGRGVVQVFSFVFVEVGLGYERVPCNH